MICAACRHPELDHVGLGCRAIEHGAYCDCRGFEAPCVLSPTGTLTQPEQDLRQGEPW